MVPSDGGLGRAAALIVARLAELPPATLPFLSTVIVPRSTPAALPRAGRRGVRRLASRRCGLAGAVSAGRAAGCSVSLCLLAAPAALASLFLPEAAPPAAFQLLEAELVVFLHLAHLLLHLQDLEVQLLDRCR